VKINELRLSAGTNTTNQFIELYNAGPKTIDLSGWTLVNTQSQWAPVQLAKIPTGTKLASGEYYLLGLAQSGLAAPAEAGAVKINVRNTVGLEVGQPVDIDGESRTVASIGAPAAPMTIVFEPVSTGPWLTIPAGATNLPVANAAGFVVGEKIGIDVGGNYEIATVTAVGKAATQTTLSAAAAAGSTNLRVEASANMSAGDTLTVGTGGRKESVKVKSVGSAGANGTGIELTAPLRLDHAASVDVSDIGTGISFAPATKFAHSSGDAVQPLGSGITLDRPLAQRHGYGAPVIYPRATTAGYQGPPAPRQWFGGPLSTRAGSIALLEASGSAVVDALVYGSQQSSSSGNGTITSPELATLEGDQGKGGCIVVVPGPAGAAGRSRGRFPDGFDADSNCTDFLTQAATSLPVGAAAGAANIKVTNITGFAVGQPISIDAGENAESAVIASVGTAGATTVSTAVSAGATVLPVASGMGFSAGQTITIGSGEDQETAVVAATSFGRGGGRITVSAPLTKAHAGGAVVSGSGITLTAPLSKAHANGTPVAGDVPTPGGPNRFFSSPPR
jgi:sRNA-binding protein